jgi:hypothetical protein
MITNDMYHDECRQARDDEPDHEGDRRCHRFTPDRPRREAELAHGAKRRAAEAVAGIADRARLGDRAVRVDGQPQYHVALERSRA